MDAKDVDLNLLVAFHAMVEQRQVTRAGETIGLSQPAMSAALARLRRLFDDPLFVKIGTRMQPTPRALELAEPVRRIVETVNGELLQRAGFDPLNTERTFTILTPDVGEVNFLPKLMSRLGQLAPRARLRAITRPRLAAAEAMEAGVADLAVGYFPDLQKAGFYQQKLFESSHVCLVRRGHPQVGDKLTMREYLQLSHAVVRPDGREHVFEQVLNQRGIRRRVALELSHFMSLLPILESSDLVATVPHDLAEVCVAHGDLRVVEAPIKTVMIPLHQFWHSRFHKDAANVWLRGFVRSAFGPGAVGKAQLASPPGER